MLSQSLYGLWKLYDPPGWQKWFGAAVLGFAFALSEGVGFSILQLQGLLIGVSSILSYNQSVNDCFDVEIDKAKAERTGKKLIVSGIISRKTALTMTLLILIVGLVSTWMTSLSLFFLAVLMAFLGTVYSVPPFRLKMRYPYSTLTQFVGCFLPFLAGVAVLLPISLQPLIITSVFGFITMVHRFMHEIHNYEMDAMTGKMTVAVRKGLMTARVLRIAFLLIGITEFLVFSFFGLVSLGLVLLFFVYLLLCVENLWANHLPEPLNKLAGLALTVASLILLPISIFVTAIL
jgi:4-hydroxybenzoate polyprenyltransferase